MREFGRPHGPAAIAEGLARKEPVAYSLNGNRAGNGAALRAHLATILPRIGVTRIADISFLSPLNYPVFQSCRPSLFVHAHLGQNSGSQGKGPSREQALTSCMMEALEQYCSEPRSPHLIRATYDYLKHHHVVLDPRRLFRILEAGVPAAAPALDEYLMWTPAYSLTRRLELLIPAETVYFPVTPREYDTRSIFPAGTNGLASGATYLEAVIHGLYELIERHYYALLFRGGLRVEALIDDGLDADVNGDFELQLYALEIENLKNVPMMMCLLVGNEEVFVGFGCSATVEISKQRAISEALQGYATSVSGAREDLEPPPTQTVRAPGAPVQTIFSAVPQPDKRTLTFQAYRKRVHNKKFTTLNAELEFACRFAQSLGATELFAANLTRVGLEVPVVKVVATGLEMPDQMRAASRGTGPIIARTNFRNMRSAQ